MSCKRLHRPFYFVFSVFPIAHFTVTGENEVRVDLVLIQPFPLYYVKYVVVMLTSILLSIISIRIGAWFVSKQVNHSLTFTQRLGY